MHARVIRRQIKSSYANRPKSSGDIHIEEEEKEAGMMYAFIVVPLPFRDKALRASASEPDQVLPLSQGTTA